MSLKLKAKILFNSDKIILDFLVKSNVNLVTHRRERS